MINHARTAGIQSPLKTLATHVCISYVIFDSISAKINDHIILGQIFVWIIYCVLYCTTAMQTDLCSNSAFHTGAKMDFISKVWVISMLCSTCFWLFTCSNEWLDRMGVPTIFLSITLWNICNMVQSKHMGRQDIQMQARNTKQIISLDGSCIMNGEVNHTLTTSCKWILYLL